MTRDARHIALVVVLAVMLALTGGVAGWSMRGARIEPPVTDTIRIHTVDTIRIASVPDTVTNTVTKFLNVPATLTKKGRRLHTTVQPAAFKYHVISLCKE